MNATSSETRNAEGRDPIMQMKHLIWISEDRDPIYRVPPLAPFMGEGSRHNIPMNVFNCMIASPLAHSWGKAAEHDFHPKIVTRHDLLIKGKIKEVFLTHFL